MATAPQAILDVWHRVRDLYNGPGRQDEELAGVVGDKFHSFGFHLAPNELPASDYSLQTARDKAGAQKHPDDASALDIHFGPKGMRTVTKRLVASAKDPHDPRLNCLFEFCGTTNGTSPHPFTVDTGTDDPDNTQGWDDSHVTHVHLSFHRDVSNDFAAMQGVADVVAGIPLTEEFSMTPAEETRIKAMIDARADRTDAAILEKLHEIFADRHDIGHTLDTWLSGWFGPPKTEGFPPKPKAVPK